MAEVTKGDATILDRFLTTGWPALVAAGPSATGEPPGATIAARLALHGFAVPPALEALLAPLAAHAAPRLRTFHPGSDAPAPEAAPTNRAVELLLAAQAYRPLWAEIFAGAFELGAVGDGDTWVLTIGHQTPPEMAVYVYGHEDDGLHGPAADGLAAFAAAVAAPVEHAAALAGHVEPARFPGLEAVAPLAVEGRLPVFLVSRARWLVTLLAETDPSAAEIERAFHRDANPRIDAAAVEKRRANLGKYAPTAFHTAFAAYFTAEDAVVASIADILAGAALPLLRDLGGLLRELLAGERTALGTIADLPALRRRVLALDLMTPPAPPAADPADAPLDALVNEDGYRDEDRIQAFVAAGDRSFVPRLLARAQDRQHLRPLYFDILRDWFEASAIAPLAEGAREVDRFHLLRRPFVELVLGAGGPEHTPLLVELVHEHADDATERRTAELLALAVLTLGVHGTAAALPVIRPFVGAAKKTGASSSAPVSLRGAADFAAAELGAADLLPDLLERMGSDELAWRAAGLRWALGRLGQGADAATRAAILARLDEVEIRRKTLTDEDGNEQPLTLASLFEGELEDNSEGIADEIALEHTRVLLGAPGDNLAFLVTTTLARCEEAEPLVWALLALRSRKELGAAHARRATTSEHAVVRMLAHLCLA